MSMVHVLKCDPRPFFDVKVGVKRAELRIDDRPYQTGDYILLCEYVQGQEYYSHDTVSLLITHMLSDTMYGLKPGYVMLSIIHVDIPAHLMPPLPWLNDF